MIIDGDNANTATTVMGYAQAIVAQLGAPTAASRVAAAHRRAVEPRVWYNPQLRSTLFLVPGLIAYIAMITAVVSTALSIVREKERGTMEQVRMAPLAAASYIVGKTVPYLALSFVSALAAHLSSRCCSSICRCAARGCCCAAIAVPGRRAGAGAGDLDVRPTQQVAFQVALLSSFLPTFILSGFIFPIASMPGVVQVVTHIVPARYFLVALRAIVLKGAASRRSGRRSGGAGDLCHA